MEHKWWSLFVWCSISLIMIAIYIIYSKKWAYGVVGLFFLLGILRFMIHPVTQESRLVRGQEGVEVTGKVVALHETTYGEQAILASVQLGKQELGSKLTLYMPQADGVTVGDWIKGYGRLEPLTKPMNPSDYDYGNWQRAQGICGTMKIKWIQIIKQGEKNPLADLRAHLSARIQRLFGGRDAGLINLLVLGESTYAPEQLLEAYYDLGVGHLLSISGFHLTTLILGIWFILAMFHVPYSARHGCVVLIIWSYGVLVGLGTATVRAAIVATVLAIGRCWWQEEDLPTSLALAGGVIVWGNPYVLGTPSFQLSFGAMIGVIVCSHLSRLMSNRVNLTSFMQQVLGTVMITLVILPIMAYHFFEISLLGVILNLLFIPVFAVILPVSFILIGLSYLSFGLAYGLGYLLTSLVQAITRIAVVCQKIGFGNWTVGRPSMLELVLYGMTLILAILVLEQLLCPKEEGWWRCYPALLVGVMSIWLMRSLVQQIYPSPLEITQLYVGQGDAAVIRTPRNQYILMDGGKYGQGLTIQSFLKYKGCDRIDLVIVSHPHEDHIGGVLELLEMRVPIGGIVIGETPKTEETRGLITQLRVLAMDQEVPLYEIEEETCITLEQVELVFKPVMHMSDTNEASMLCLVNYGAYTHLFTGDIGEIREGMLENLGDIDVLKVAHHGSGYSTTEDFLLQTKPEYGMISSGKNNLYQHPHPQTLSRLENHDVTWYDTKEVGAVWVRTDGETLTIRKQIQKEPRTDDGDRK